MGALTGATTPGCPLVDGLKYLRSICGETAAPSAGPGWISGCCATAFVESAFDAVGTDCVDPGCAGGRTDVAAVAIFVGATEGGDAFTGAVTTRTTGWFVDGLITGAKRRGAGPTRVK